jgi:hypothetical protein|tara:strand:- start:359 stop:883 length:525 start_codon:yes stop_codon:yes gene_type:complete
MKEKVSLPIQYPEEDFKSLLENNYLEFVKGAYTITIEGKILMAHLDNYFLKAKKKTNIQLMGKDFNEKIKQYREIFPAKKLPSGKPARQNVKALTDSFRWFFESYDHTWDDVIKATKMYVNEYRDADYLYMVTSQYFVSKQDKHKVKVSLLADYCDLIKEGVDTTEDHFKEKVV